MLNYELQFGVSKEIITPCETATMIGFGTMFGVPFQDIHDDLYVRTLLLKDKSGEVVLLLAFDLLFHDDSLPKALRKYVNDKYGVNENNLHVSYTHTHFGPAVKGYDFNWHTESYEKFLFDRACRSIDKAFISIKNGCMKYSKVSGDWNVSRRLMVNGVMEFLPSPDGECDKNLYLLKLEDENGIMKALVMNFACHPSNLGAYSVLSSEYPGRLCQRVEGEFYGCTALFFQGFGADAKLKIGMKTSRFSGITYDECDEVALSMTERIKKKLLENTWKELPIDLGSRVFKLELPLEINPKEYYKEVSKCHSGREGAHFEKTPGDLNNTSKNTNGLFWACADYIIDNYDELPEYLPLNCGIVRINPNFYIFSMGGEPGCNIGTILRQSMPDLDIVCFGYNDAIAYVPSDKMISEGGYEAGDKVNRSITEYRLKGSVKHGVDKIYCDGFKKVIEELN